MYDEPVGSHPFARWWEAHHPGIAPVGFVLREACAERWLRVHSLPGSKRYPDADEDWATLLDRQRAIASEVLAEGAEVWLVAAEHELDRRGRVPEIAEIALEKALELRVDHDAIADSSPWAFHVASVRWDPARFEPLLRAIADDARRPSSPA